MLRLQSLVSVRLYIFIAGINDNAYRNDLTIPIFHESCNFISINLIEISIFLKFMAKQCKLNENKILFLLLDFVDQFEG